MKNSKERMLTIVKHFALTRLDLLIWDVFHFDCVELGFYKAKEKDIRCQYQSKGVCGAF